MNFTENAKTKFWADLSNGIKATFGHGIGEAFHIDQYKSGRFSFTESVTGGAGAVTQLMDKIKASSPVIESVRMTPIANGYNATYNVSVEFDPVKAESVYSDGKTAYACVDMDGKKYVVDNNGNKVKQVKDDKEADAYIANLNKSTKSNLKKEEELETTVDEDGFPIQLDSVIALANDALEGTGVTISNEGGQLLVRGSAELVKPTQEFVPAPYYGADTIDGGYNDETGDLALNIPEYPTDYELEELRSFLISAVNCIIDNALCKADTTTCEDDEWCAAMEEAEPCESVASQYRFKGESFVGNNKGKVAVLFKSLLQEDVNEAKKVAAKYMGAEMAEGFARKYAPEKVVEKHQAVISDEMALLDRMHESAMNRAPEKTVEMDSIVAKNMYNKEK